MQSLTSHPNDIDQNLINEHKETLNDAISSSARPSRTNKILKNMNRKHTREFYLN